MEWEEIMETLKALALAVAIGFPLLVLLSMTMSYLIRTQHKWRKLPPNPTPPAASWAQARKVSK
jgi:hypothetical protein